MDIRDFYKQFCSEEYDSKGRLCRFEITAADDFNFAYDAVDAIAALEPERRAMVWTNEQGKERIFTFRQISDYSAKAANLFRAHGIGKGDTVLLILKRNYQFWFAVLGLHKLGAVAVPATHLLTKKDIAYRVEAASIKGVVCTCECESHNYIDAAEQELGVKLVKFSAMGAFPGYIDFDAEIEKQPAKIKRVPVTKTDGMLLYFTSGTTGNPKMVLHGYHYPLAHIVTAVHWQNVDPDGLHLTLAETGWGKAAWGKLYGQWLAGTGLFVYDFEKFVPADVLHMIEKYRITTFCAPPTIFRFFIKEGMGSYDLSSLKYATIAGEALNEEVYHRFKEMTGLPLMEGYGQTETTLVVGNLRENLVKPGSMGLPSPLYDVDLVDEDSLSAAPGKVGEIVIRKKDGDTLIPGMFLCYSSDENTTIRAWRDGIYHTGDTAYRDEDGYYWYVGRTDDVIKSSGYRIGPFEVESVLMEHPAVLECAVTGIPDEIRGQLVKATIVLTSKYQPSDTLKKEIQDFVKKATAPYKYPRVIEFVDELPKTISGKIRRVEIAEADRRKAKQKTE
ncbi:MAG: AMP-binding protein [Oscillospiraceae bacterium]|nr:AMP-binding protein [Oscillospiraceae bacterium]